MSIAKPCPYSAEYEFCKYEKNTGTPNLKMCDKCNWNPRKGYAHSVSSYKARWEKFTAKYKSLNSGDIIKVYCGSEVIAILERVYNRFGYLGKFRFCDVNLDDLENVYKFLKSKKLKFKKL